MKGWGMPNPRSVHWSSPAAELFIPVPVTELELSQSVLPRPNTLGQQWVLVRLHGVPLGTMALFDEEVHAAVGLPQLAAERFLVELVEHLRRDGLSVDDPLSSASSSSQLACAYSSTGSHLFASVIICTLGEDPRLARTVMSVLAQTHRKLELIVVDNNPQSKRVLPALADIKDSRLRIVSEGRRGLSVARNTGLATAAGDIVAYTDDDAYADSDWLANLLSPFDEHSEVVCVTGLVLPAELASPAQLLFEEFGAFGKGFSRLVWSLGDSDSNHAKLGARGDGGVLFPYSAGVFGSGNNMAFRVGWLRTHGGFDVALGAGTPSRGGEDLDIFLRVMLSRFALVYEPRAIVRHFARSEFEDLSKQMYGYGSGMAAVIVKHLLDDPSAAIGILRRVPAGLKKLLDPVSSKNASKTAAFPPELTRAELRGYLAGPALYLQSRLRARHLTSHRD